VASLIADLIGRTALVTGASRGIGRAIAVGLGRCGVDVIVNYHTNAEAADQTVAMISDGGGEAHAVQADVASKPDVDRLFDAVRERFGDHVDILVNNAGGPTDRHPLSTMPEEVWRRCLALNLDSAFFCTQAAWGLLPDGIGRVINLTSISARTGGGPEASPYAAAKGGLSNFTRACAKEFAPRGITVNAIAPGVIETDLHRYGTPPEEFRAVVDRIPLGYAGLPEDVVGTVLLLCAPEGRYLTGEIIEVNGGLLMS